MTGVQSCGLFFLTLSKSKKVMKTSNLKGIRMTKKILLDEKHVDNNVLKVNRISVLIPT